MILIKKMALVGTCFILFSSSFPYKNKQINTTASGYNAILEIRFPHVFQGMMIIIVFSFFRVSCTAAWRVMTPASSPGTTPPSTLSTTSRRTAWRSSSSRRSSSLTATRHGYSLVMLYLPWDNVSGDGKKRELNLFSYWFLLRKIIGKSSRTFRSEVLCKSWYQKYC